MPDSTNTMTGEVPVILPAQDACCESPCDPPWVKGPTCILFTEMKSVTVPLAGTTTNKDVGRGFVTVNVTYQHRLCLVGKQHGGLAYTLTLLPGEKMTLYHSDRYRRVTSEDQRFSVQTTFSQFVSALFQAQSSTDVSSLLQVLNSSSSNSGSSSGGGFFGGIFGFGGGNSSGNSSSSSSAADLGVNASASNFSQVATQAAQYTDLQRSITISSYEDSESVSTTAKFLENKNLCRAVTYFVRKVLDVYVSTTTVTAVTFRVTVGNYVSALLTPADINLVPAAYRPAVAKVLATLPKVGEQLEHPEKITVPTDGVVYDPELAHCCAMEAEREEEVLIQLEKDKAAALKAGLEVQLMQLEVQRRQALLAAGTLAPFEPAGPAPIINA